MGLVAPVDGDEVGGQRLDLACVAEPPGIDATRPGIAVASSQTTATASRSSPSTSTSSAKCSTVGSSRDSTDVVEGGDHRGLGEAAAPPVPPSRLPS